MHEWKRDKCTDGWEKGKIGGLVKGKIERWKNGRIEGCLDRRCKNE